MHFWNYNTYIFEKRKLILDCFFGKRVFSTDLANEMRIAYVSVNSGCQHRISGFWECILRQWCCWCFIWGIFRNDKLSVSCYYEYQNDRSTSLGGLSLLFSPECPLIASYYASRRSDEAHKDTAYDEKRRDSRLNYYIFRGTMVIGSRTWMYLS